MDEAERLAEIAQYRRALDDVLLTGSPAQLREFMREHHMPLPSSLAAAEVTMHKTITASKSLPLEYRKRSKAWLDGRGFMAWDDGDL